MPFTRIPSFRLHHHTGPDRRPAYVSGHSFSSLARFKEAVGAGHAVLRPGAKVTIRMPATAGSAAPKIVGLNANSPFSVTYARGKMIIQANRAAKPGATDSIGIKQAPLVGPGVHAPETTTRFTLQVAGARPHFPRHIRLG